MSANSEIEWCTHTFNLWWGCVEVSPACDFCYARTLANRYGFKVWGKDAPRRFFGDKHWAEPLKWDKAAAKAGVRARVFCGSMCDVMEDRSDIQIHQHREMLYALIEATPNLDWLLLTKRPQNYRRFLPATWIADPRPNVWGMTTVESPQFYWRIDALKGVPFAVKGLSIEPMLGAMPTLSEHLDVIDWVIVGGESGPGARPAHPQWFRDVRDQCVAAGVAFFFKQWGQWKPFSRTDGIHETPFGTYDTESKYGFLGVGKKKAGRLLDGREWSQFPKVKP